MTLGRRNHMMARILGSLYTSGVDLYTLKINYLALQDMEESILEKEYKFHSKSNVYFLARALGVTSYGKRVSDPLSQVH